MIFEEKTLESELIYKGRILNLRKDKVTTVNGTSTREIIEHNGASVVIPVTEDNKIILVKQYRKPLEKAILEVPAGKIDPGEDFYQAAVRELKEETGYTAENMELLTIINPAAAYTTELLGIYMATGLTPGEQDLDDNEAVDVIEMDFKEAYDMVMAGDVIDAKTNIAILMAKEKLGIRF